VAGAQRVWFALYDPRDERRLRSRLTEFEIATVRAGHAWFSCDLTNAFAQWMAVLPYRDDYFASPDDLAIVEDEFVDFVVLRVAEALTRPEADAGTVVAVYGVASLFGFMRVSTLIERVAPQIRGRLLLFFPGQHDNANYRLLDARDGWNYHAVPITA
jgi:hypothetical protein